MKLQVKNASVSLNGNTILEEVNFEINDGEHIALVGRNGAGKTTLLRALENNDMFDEGVGEEKFQINKMGTFNIGYMKQVDFEDESITLLEEIQKPFKNLIDMEKKLSWYVEKMNENNSDKSIKEYTDLQETFKLLGGLR